MTDGGTLWLVTTPIGNLGDLTPRAIEVVSRVSLVCCEDTRRTGRLFHHVGIQAARLAVANEHTEYHLIDEVLDILGRGDDVAVVSDAGTPGISDPGAHLVAAAVNAGYEVSATPGPSAAIMALTISGLPTERFVFEGFLPRSGRDRRQRLDEIADETRTVVLYEAPHRIIRTIADLGDACGPDRPVAIARELTKLHEEVQRATLGTIELGQPRGEYVIVVGGASPDDTPITDDLIIESLAAELATGATTKDAVAAVAARLGQPKNRVYDLALRR